MRHFKDSRGGVFAFEADRSQDDLIAAALDAGLTELSVWPPAPSLAAIQAAAWGKIKAERDRRTETGGYRVVVDGGDKWFHSDQTSRSQQQDNEAEGANLVPVQWKTMDGSFITLTAELAAQIRVARMASDREIFSVAESHRNSMKASADPAAYDFSAGWPRTFDE